MRMWAMQECMNWDELRLFLEVSRKGSFTKAAQALNIKQSTVSRRIAQLEDTLGYQLFDRKHARLTPLGERVALGAKGVEEGVIAILDEVRHYEATPSGTVRLALTESLAVHVLLPSVLPALRERHPEIQLELKTGYELAQLNHREAEMALRFVKPQSGELVGKRIAQMPTTVLAHRKFQHTHPDELPWVLAGFEEFSTSEEAWFEGNVGREPTLRTSSYLTQIAAVRSGVGAAILPRTLLQIDPDLVELGSDWKPGPILDLWLVTPEALRNVPRIRAVWEVLETEIPLAIGE